MKGRTTMATALRLPLVYRLALIAQIGVIGHAATAATEVMIAQNGEPRCAIMVAEHAPPVRREQAEELAAWLSQIVGANFEVSTGDRPLGIVFGTWDEWQRAIPGDRAPAADSESYRIWTDGERVWVIARTDAAGWHSVYGLLELLGCRWFFPDPVWTVIPKKPTVSLDVDHLASPAFQYRRIWYGWGPRTAKLARDYQEWLRHNRQLGSFQISCGHSYDTHIPRGEFERHPEWFALVNGKRQPSQLCTTHPEVQARVTASVLDRFRKNPDLNMVSVEPNDGDGYCECEKCRAVGSPSDRVFHLANVVANAVRGEFPDKWVGLLAYAGHSEPPRFDLAPGVYVQITTGFRYTKLSFEEQVRAFRQRGARPGVYDYFSVYPWDWDMPGAAKAGRVYELAEAIRHYRDLGLTTFDAESSCNWGPNGLGYWMAAHLMWDPDLDAHQLVEDFCRSAFGDAAPHIRRIYERWAKGERFSARSLKLALSDLEQAYRSEASQTREVRDRLDRLAMYLHWLKLWYDYDRSARWNQWGKLAVAKPEEIVERARRVVTYTRRIMDTGLIHAYPALESEWFRHRFAALGKIPEFDWQQVSEWKKEGDIPTHEEVWHDFQADVASFADLPAVEIKGREYHGKLVPLAERAPRLVEAWGQVPRSRLFVESGRHFFVARDAERLSLAYVPFDAGHTIDCHWQLFRVQDSESAVLGEGHVIAEKGKPATALVEVPKAGIYAFDPGTAYWRAAEIQFDVRPLSVWAGRPSKGFPQPLRLWLPRARDPLYLYVPAHASHFVLGIVEGGDPFTTVRITRADGTVLLEEKVLAGEQISIILPSRSGQPSGSARDSARTDGGQPGNTQPPQPPQGEILALSLDSLRCVIELYDVPPYLARHPGELLVPEDALTP